MGSAHLSEATTMRSEELAQRLREMYDEAEVKRIVGAHFGILYARELHACGASLKELVAMAGIPRSYDTELSKGIRLSEHVEPRAGSGAS